MSDIASKIPVVGVVGPTASGKSALGLEVAKALNGEIVCMDSMQIYQGMDIGTAKPTKAEQAMVPHHMLDIVAPTRAFTVSDYAALADEALRDVWARGKTPVLVGGTGLYLKALKSGLTLGVTKGDENLRAELHEIADAPGGKERLHGMLKEVDAASAAKFHANDVRRVVRALEVFRLTGTPFSSQEEREITGPEGPFAFCLLGMVMERERLYERVNLRVENMMAAGLPREVEALLAAGVPKDAQAMQGIGYKELIPMLEGRMPRGDAVYWMKQNTRHYAKRQWTWFRGEKQIQWLDALDPAATSMGLELAGRFLREQSKA